MRPVAILTAATLIALVDVSVLAFGDRTTPVGVDEALARYQEERASADATGPTAVERSPADDRQTPVTDPAEEEPTGEAEPEPGSTAPADPPPGTTTEPARNGSEPSPDPSPRTEAPHERDPTEAPSRQRAPAGVYVYETSGYEEVDVLGGSRHDYPDQTTITVRHTDCGVRTRWEPIRERWEEMHLCRGDGGWEMREIATYHEFFQQGDVIEYRCDPGALVLPDDPRPGQAWTWRCTADEGSQTTETRVIELGTRTVGGESVEAVHLIHTSRLEGNPEGERVYDVWFSRSGLELESRITVDADVRAPFGRTRYVERVERRLTSLRPRT